MQIIKHNLDGILVISIVLESQEEIESVRALCGGTSVLNSIQASSTPKADGRLALEYIRRMTAILNPLSDMFKEA